MRDTLPLLSETTFPALKRNKLETLQVNLGYKCNQQCLHCHVNASPKRKEIMPDDIIESVIRAASSFGIKTIDLTGGAPEIHPRFRYLVSSLRQSGIHIIDRCNLTILNEPDQEDLAEFLADNEVEIVASLPCYTEENVNKQRGEGVFESSLVGLKQLNSLGYGKGKYILNLVYNPTGAFLPPAQTVLENDYKRILKSEFDIVFDSLYTITNMPIKRFGSTLLSNNEFYDYMELLRNNHNPANLNNVMCRKQISVDWQGYLYDCDFNQMLGMNIKKDNKNIHINDMNLPELQEIPIAVAEHCYGCTAGCGSSCGGSLS